MIFKPDEETQRLKWVFSSCKNGAWGAEADGETDVVCIRAADFDGRLGRLNGGERTLRSVDPETYDKLALRRGDIILEKSGGGEKQLVGRAAIYDGNEPSITSNFLARCRPAPGMEPAFVNYLLLAIYNGRGTFPNLKQSTGIQNLDLASFLDIRVRIPPLDTQRRIARFLDEKTARIDGLIEKKRALLDRLAEKRQTLITRAVTKGLNPDAPMNPSGIHWLGDIPTHWEVFRLRYAVKNLNNMRVPIAAEMRKGVERTYPYYGASGIIDYVDEYIFDFPAVLVAEDGANLLSRSTPLSFVAEGKYWVNNHAHILKPEKITIWFCSSLLALYPLDPWISGSAQPKLTKDNLGSLEVWVPPLDEQRQIEASVKEEAAQLQQARQPLEKSIEALEEYRSALITASITGQLAELR